MVNGKQKGASFERSICVALSQWLSEGKRKDLLWRSAMSGGRATLGLRKGEKHLSQGGDVSAINPLGATLTDYFYIEIKFYKDLDLAGFWFNRGCLYQFWMKAKADARHYSKEPMLIAKQNRYETLVLLFPGSSLARRSWVQWSNGECAVGRFDSMLKMPYKGKATVERWRPK